MASEGLHEPLDALDDATQELHRALVSLGEELEAVDWYQQRAAASGDAALRDVLKHNRDEEVEHAAMVLEWIRRNDPVFDRQLKRYLFSDGDIAVDTPGAVAAVPAIGSLKR
jgi:ferritin-like protein